MTFSKIFKSGYEANRYTLTDFICNSSNNIISNVDKHSTVNFT